MPTIGINPKRKGRWVLIRRIFCALTALAVLAGFPVDAGSTPEEAMVRLHVVADDDTEEAQALKLEVRDAVLAAAQSLLTDCADAQSAWETVNAALPELTEAARARAEACGYEGRVRAETGVFQFPDRDYGGTLVPAGDYRALRVVIGDGEGKNWWCVLFPGLCLPVEGERHWMIVDWLRSWFGGDGW